MDSRFLFKLTRGKMQMCRCDSSKLTKHTHTHTHTRRICIPSQQRFKVLLSRKSGVPKTILSRISMARVATLELCHPPHFLLAKLGKSSVSPCRLSLDCVTAAYVNAKTLLSTRDFARLRNLREPFKHSHRERLNRETRDETFE